MKGILLAVAALMIAAPVFAQKSVNPADYPLTARVLSDESHTSMSISPLTNYNTGAVTGSSTSFARTDRQEIKIDDVIYITFLRGRANMLDGKVGDIFPAIIVTKSHREFIYLLGVDKKTGKPRVVTLQVTGRKVE